MIYFLVTTHETNGDRLCKIGYSSGAKSVAARKKAASTSLDFSFHAAISGNRDEEQRLHEYFRLLAYENTRETFRVTGVLEDYLHFLAEQVWAAHSLETLLDAYPAPGRFPWDRSDDFVAVGANRRLPLSLGRAVEPSRGPINSHILAQLRSGSNDWYTPPDYVEAARRVMGGIDLDPASCPEANLIVRAPEIFTISEDGLSLSWHGRVWLNPPYGGHQADFVARAIEDFHDGKITQAVLLLNSHATDTAWFQPLWKFRMCFTNHRIPFIGPNNRKSEAPTTGSVFVYMGPNTDAFESEFSAFGSVVAAMALPRIPADELRSKRSVAK